ncbi:tetratricopeptide repeat protein [Mangrovicoccus algicola]|uniref:Tetratricopeptide repeat protein 38 n=1 Tax=Mangrovicoccus algicola TaxID=2771008 RepID=A0A8J6Z129_9RHOB|nr:tetratricopeptide repeat protein [Mangrovicoccus algicola]MBE3639546.1 tetratricopeptide repeat protein [Mangrovicoccus algicola]
MTRDLFGSPVDLSSAEAVAAWNAMCRAFLAHGAATPVHLGKVLEAAPDFALGHAVRGLFCMLLGRREMTEAAAAAHRTALATEPPDARSRAMISALGAMLARDPARAAAGLEELLRSDPVDTLAMKLGHGIRFLTGDAAGMRLSVERVLPAHGADHPGRGYALGCHAFALEETGAHDLAEAAGRAAIDLAGDDAWGLHAIAHVHDMTGRSAEGIALIDRHRAVWEGANNFRYHVWWHKALLHLDRGETATALELYDRRIRAERTDDYRDIANATSLLMRLELDGVSAGTRWEELADLAEARSGDGCLVFADLHYMLALIGGERGAAQDRLHAGLARRARQADPMAAICADPGLAAAEGLAAFGAGQYAQAAACLESALPHLPEIGGSHAQRDVFERIAVDAALRAGQAERAASVLARRRARRGGYGDGFALSRQDRLERLRQSVRSAAMR